MHSSSWYANPGDVFSAKCRMWLIRLPALRWRDRPDFAFALLSAGSFAPIIKWSTRPHGLFTLPAAVHAWEQTCHFKQCSYVIFTSNTDEIVLKYCNYMSSSLPANISLRFCKHWYLCKKYGNIFLFIYHMGIWFSTGIYRLTLVIKHWEKKSFFLKRCGQRDQKYL